MQQYQIKNQSDAIFCAIMLDKNIFQLQQNIEKYFPFLQENTNSKFKIPRLKNEEAKSIFHQLNHKSTSKQSSSKKNWKFQQTCLLVFLLEKYSLFQSFSNLSEVSNTIWEEVSKFLPGRSSKDCKYKVLSLTASTITNIPWSSQQRKILTQIIEQEGMNWNLVSQILYEKSDQKVFRTSKQCRQHYMCFLKPNLKKGAWTQQQDYKLVCLFLQFGRKWSKIMKFIEGRNQNSIKNRFFLLFENKGKTSNHSDLLRKVKRKKERMDKNPKTVELGFSFSMQQKSSYAIFTQKTCEKDSQIEQQKQDMERQTLKGIQTQLSKYLLKYEDEIVISRKQLQQYPHSRNRLSLNSCHSYQHLEFSQVQIGNKNEQSLDAFESFEQYICF